MFEMTPVFEYLKNYTLYLGYKFEIFKFAKQNSSSQYCHIF